MNFFAAAAADDPFAPVKCKGCNKDVFPTEKVTALKSTWHKGCLKCAECGFTLNPRNMESYQNTPYCKAHKPNPKATQTDKRADIVQATKAPRAQRRVQGVQKDARMTFAPGRAQRLASTKADTGTNRMTMVSAPDHIVNAPAPKAPSASYAHASYGSDKTYDAPAGSVTSAANQFAKMSVSQAPAPAARKAPPPVPQQAAAPYAEEAYAEEAYAEEGYAEEEYYEEAYPEEAYAEEAYAEEAYAEEAYAEEAYAEEAYPEEAYAEEAYAEEAYPAEAYAEEGYAEEAYAEEGYYEEGGEYYEEGGEYYEEGGEYYEEGGEYYEEGGEYYEEQYTE